LGIPGANLLSAGERPTMTPAQEESRDRTIRQAMARAIASSRGFGANNLLLGRRTYSNAQISGPHWEKGVFGGELKYYCARAHIENLSLLGSSDIKFSALISEGPGGINVTGSRDWGETRCSTPFRAFPELEAYNRQA
jgi:hypothetical protein